LPHPVDPSMMSAGVGGWCRWCDVRRWLSTWHQTM